MSSSTLHRVPYRDLALRSLDQLPPFSPVVNHVMASLSDDDVSFAKLAVQIESDTVLSGNVLRMVNSVLYGRRGTVSSIPAAISILGINKLRNLLLGLSVTRLWARVRTPPGWSTARFNDHSMAVAVMGDILVQKAKVDYPEGAFVAGLLHDLGRLMLAITLPEEFLRVQVERKNTGKPLEQCEQELLEVSHSELSAAALARWNLPPAIQKAVLYHHRWEADPNPVPAGYAALSTALAAANEIVNANGRSITLNDVDVPANAGQALVQLGLSLEDGTLLEAFEAEFKAVRGYA